MLADNGVRFGPPSHPRADVVRRRLIEHLAERFTRALTLVVAPAGHGKTTLLKQALAENRLAPRAAEHWLTCGPDDSIGSTLAGGLLRALDPRAPGSVTADVEAVVEAIWHRSPDDVVLVLDDVHEIAEGSAGAALLSDLVAALPANGHLVLAGRRPPPISLARREVEGRVARIGEAELRFTDHELAAFAAARDVPVEHVASSGGWPALAELGASAHSDVAGDYLWEEVLGHLPPQRLRDLALLAHVGGVDDDLATIVLGRPTDVAALTAGFPLVAATAAGVHQIHPLWRPHLAKAVDDGEIADARRRAGVELAASGDVAGAVRLLTEAGAWDELTSVVARVLAAPDPPVPGDVVASWLGRLPESMAAGPLTRLLGAVAGVQTDPAAASRELADAAGAFAREGNVDGELACIAQLGQIAWWSDQPERLAVIAARLFELEAQGVGRAVPLACLARALICDMAADCDGVLAELDRLPPGALSRTSECLVHWMRSTTYNHLGRPGEALAAAELACAEASPLHAPIVEAARVQARWFLGEVDDALREFPPLVERAASTGLRDYTSLLAASCCTILAGAGHADEAAVHLERARRSATSPDFPVVDASLVIAEAVLAIAAGDERSAAAVLRDYVDRSPPLGTGMAAFAQQRSLAVWYVLVPGCRADWDRADLGPCFATARRLARDLVTVRTDGCLPAAAAVPDAPTARSLLPLPWATELAMAHIDAGRGAGWGLLEALWPEAQAAVRSHAAEQDAPLRQTARAALARLPAPPAARLELKLLGPVELRRDGVPVDRPEWGRERVRALLAHLALERPVSRERLATNLWPDRDADAQQRNLRVTLTHLLRTLEPDRAERDASFLVRPHGAGLLLHDGEWFTTDVWRFDELWARARAADDEGRASAALDALVAAVRLWRGDPTELATHHWALTEVEERRFRLVRMATRAAELLLARDRPDAAREMAEAALRTDPWSERAHELAIAAHTAAGDPGGARRARDRYRAAQHDLGMDPMSRSS